MTLTTRDVAYIAGESNPSRIARLVRALELDHLQTGSGHTIRWADVDVLTVAFARWLVDPADGNRSYIAYREVAYVAAKWTARDDLDVGWIVITERQKHVYPADKAAQCAAWLLAHREAARVLCCGPIIARWRERSSSAAVDAP